jgi:tetratricopeptide (TPR) repeat protein
MGLFFSSVLKYPSLPAGSRSRHIIAVEMIKKPFGPTHALILITIMILILAPRPLAGFLDLRSAGRFEAALNGAKAAQAYAAAAERLPWMPSMWEKAGLASMQAADIKNAISFLNMAVENGAISKWGWLALGEAYQASGQLSQAIDAWENALPLIQANSDLATAQRLLGNFTGAIEYWRTTITMDPENPAAHYMLGLLLMATAPEEALPELIQSASLDPGLDPTVQGLRTALNKSLTSDDRVTHFLAAGQALASLGEWDLAAEAFRQAISLRSNDAEAWAWLGEAQQQQGHDGSSEMDQALAFNPGSAMVQGLYGLYLQRQGEPETARAAFQKAVDLEPGDAGWQMALGSAWEQTGDLVSAYDHYLRAVKLAPQTASTWRALAAFSLNNSVDLVDTGRAAALKLVGLAPEDWQSYDLAGQMEFQLEDYSAAEVFLMKAIHLDPTQAATALHLGLVYLQTRDSAAAWSYLNLARTFDPDGSYGWQAERLLERYFP